MRDEAVAVRLFEQTGPRVDEDDGQVVEAPVTMFRVYSMWPGASAMNRRSGVAKYR